MICVCVTAEHYELGPNAGYTGNKAQVCSVSSWYTKLRYIQCLAAAQRSGMLSVKLGYTQCLAGAENSGTPGV